MDIVIVSFNNNAFVAFGPRNDKIYRPSDSLSLQPTDSIIKSSFLVNNLF